ncbi:MAG: hypothetical protein ACREOM_13615, partial [Candidatus Dormibacteraceae bacterium]
FVVNKADIEGHLRVVTELRAMLSLAAPRALGGEPRQWKPPIVPAVASKQEGIAELWEAVLAHRRYLESSGLGRRLAEQRLRDETAEVGAELARERVRRALDQDPNLAKRLLEEGTPYNTAEEILDRKPGR